MDGQSLARDGDPIGVPKVEPEVIRAGRQRLTRRVQAVPVEAVRGVSAFLRPRAGEHASRVVKPIHHQRPAVSSGEPEAGPIPRAGTGLPVNRARHRPVVAQVLGQDHRSCRAREQEGHRQSGDQGGQSTLAQIPEPVVSLAPPALDPPGLVVSQDHGDGIPLEAMRTSLSIGCCLRMSTISEITPAQSRPVLGSNT